MDTLVSLHVRADDPVDEVAERLERAFGWFDTVEHVASRFDPESEVMQLVAHVGTPVTVSPMLFTLIQFARTVAELSDGAFDPTVGALLERCGFNHNYRTGQTVASAIAPTASATYRDIALDPMRQTVTLRAPLILDLGAVAKGFAIDLAAKELSVYDNYAVEAGGDMTVHGRNAEGEPWSVGIRHPRSDGDLIARLAVLNAAVCTSGDYERPSLTREGDHHLIDPRIGASPHAVASVTVIAPTAMLADTLSTAALVLGPVRGIPFLEAQGVDGLIIAPTLEHYTTSGFMRYLQ